VLYPGSLAAERIQAVYVPSNEHRALVLAWCDAVGRPEPPVEVRSDLLS
jgi:hypothetical protein